MNEEKQAVMTALSKLVNYRAYDGEPFFFVDLYELAGKDIAREVNSLLNQLCESLGTTIEARLNYKFEYEPLRYKAIPGWDADRALEVAINNVMVASTDLDRMLRNSSMQTGVFYDTDNTRCTN